jgi:hypothetical protein
VRNTTKRWLAPLLAGAAAIGALGLPAPAAAQEAGLPSVGTSFEAQGPYRVTQASAGGNTFFFPANAGEGGVRHPVILWGNGTGAPVASYRGLLNHYASHGFVVAAANTTNAMSGREMLAGLDQVARWNGQSGHPLSGAVNLERVGATGHSQGAYGAVAAGGDERVDTVFPLQGGNRAANVESAIFFAGGSDAVVSPRLVRSGFSGSRVPAAYAELRGASHFVPVGNGGGFRGPSTAWARAELAGDAQAAALFRGGDCGLCRDGQWTFETNAAFDQRGPVRPPAEQPPTTTPTTPAPPAERPPTPAPPAEQPPAEQPPAEQPPTDRPDRPGLGGGERPSFGEGVSFDRSELRSSLCRLFRAVLSRQLSGLAGGRPV